MIFLSKNISSGRIFAVCRRILQFLLGFLFVGKGEATGDVCHCRMVRIRIACSSCRRPVCGKVTIYLRNDKGKGEIIFEGGGRGNVKRMVYEVIAISQNRKIAKSQLGCSLRLINKINIYSIIIYIYIIIEYLRNTINSLIAILRYCDIAILRRYKSTNCYSAL